MSQTARRWSAVVVACLLLLSGVARGQTSSEPVPALDLGASVGLPAKLTLDEAKKIFLERGYDLLLSDANVMSVQGSLRISEQIANPAFGVSYGRSFGVSEDVANGFSVSANDSGALLDTLIIGKRRLRTEIATAALEATKLGRADAERTLLGTVKQAYVAVVATRQQLDVNGEILKSMQQTEDLVAVRYKLGAISEADLATQRTATYEAAQQVEIATQAHEQARVALAFLLGARGQTPSFEVDTSLFEAEAAKTVQDATPEVLHDLARDHRPDILAQRKQVQRAEASIRSTERQVIPDIAVGAAYSQQGVGSAAITPPTLTFDLTFTPPIFYRQQGELTIARADLRSQQINLAKLQSQILSDVDTGYSAFGAARRRLNRLNHGYLEQAQLARDLTKVQYEKGAASLVALLVAQRAYVTTVSEHIQALTDFWTAVFQLETATGTEFKS